MHSLEGRGHCLSLHTPPRTQEGLPSVRPLLPLSPHSAGGLSLGPRRDRPPALVQEGCATEQSVGWRIKASLKDIKVAFQTPDDGSPGKQGRQRDGIFVSDLGSFEQVT